jgi:uncharacterized protein
VENRRRESRETTFEGSPGLGYAVDRIRRFLRPPVAITPPPAGVRFECNVGVPVRDGTVLRVNVFRPAADGRYPVIMCAHPYGKDHLPRRGRSGYRPPLDYRLWRQSAPFGVSAWTSWESPDPAYWVPRGYVVVNCDFRGFGRSDGAGSLLTDAEAQDYYDLIEWAAVQPWSSGRVGLNGVSYLALSQWRVAALRPPSSRRSVPGRALATCTGTSPIRAGSGRTGSCRCGAR